MYGTGLRVCGIDFWVFSFRVLDLGYRVPGFAWKGVSDFRFRVLGFGFQVSGITWKGVGSAAAISRKAVV